MKNTLVTLTLGQASCDDFRPLLREILPDDRILHAKVLSGLTTDQIVTQFAPEIAENSTAVKLQNGPVVHLSTARLKEAAQQRILALESSGFETILMLCGKDFHGLYARHATLLEPDRLLPPLVMALVAHQKMGVVVAHADAVNHQREKWLRLGSRPLFAVANPWQADNQSLFEAGLMLQEKGADVMVLDCLGFQLHHQRYLENMLGIPVVLSHLLIAQLAAELVQ
ncbi:hypothetical protein CIG19_15965 [Enterobacterales bacterium CwR94]|nr:hypothetical protein CIG19_15965 [Enterobacterales bacterium CwR94]